MMDDDSLMDVNLTDLDLNQQPIDPPLDGVMRFGSLLNDLESTHGRIEERIRQLEAVTTRARQRQRWRQARSIEIGHYSSQIVGVGNDRATLDGNNSVAVVERTPERSKGCKRDSSHLVAKALGMDSEIKKPEKEGGSFYDCNICLDLANEPVLTCCGHLFCWACFYQVSYIDSYSKECPVCKGEVSDNTVIPIYGNGNTERVNELESGLKIPPRPKARRVESVRQQRANQGLSHVPVAEALRRIRISIGAIDDQTPEQEGRTVISTEGQNVDGRRIRIHQVSRVLSESAASLSSLSSALSSAERLVEDLESVISNGFLRNDGSAPQANNQPLDTTAAAEPSEVTGSVLRVRTMRSSSEIGLPVAPSTSFTQRRRSNVSRTPDVDNRDTRESRRRRLN